MVQKDLEYPKELCDPLAQNKIEIKSKMSNYRLKIADLLFLLAMLKS